MNFTSHHDAPVRLAALLVNTLTPGQRGGRRYLPPGDDQLPVAASEIVRSVHPDPRTLTVDEAHQLVEFAASLRDAFASVAVNDLDTAVGHVEALLRVTRAEPTIVRHDEQSWHVHYLGTAGGAPARWVGACATGLAIVLGSDARSRLGLCSAPGCDRVYVDTSHNGGRLFCSLQCQNRIKAAAYRARARAS